MIKDLQLQTDRLTIRHFALSDLPDCIRFRRQVFGLEEQRTTAEAWLKWTIDSYREWRISVSRLMAITPSH